MFIKFGTKAENLISVSPFLKNANVLPQVSFTVDRWNNSSNEVIKELELLGWDSKYLIIRSSSQCEDTLLHSNAGEFLSIQNVYGVDNISNAIIKVIASYNDNNPENQVLIQPMLTDIIQSGVVFTANFACELH